MKCSASENLTIWRVRKVEKGVFIGVFALARDLHMKSANFALPRCGGRTDGRTRDGRADGPGESPSERIPMMTYEQRLIAGLVAMGWQEDRTDRSRYTAFRKLGAESRVFVGPSGALRIGANASSSHSIGDPSRQTAAYLRVLNAGNPNVLVLQALAQVSATPLEAA